MKTFRHIIFLSALLLIFSCGGDPLPSDGGGKLPAYEPGTKSGKITYQLLIYSFADSDGDGVGDFRGITQHLDYIDALGASAIWLSPAHPAASYHGYDVEDYSTVNPAYGTEEDFRELISKAHEKDIKIYMDYVLNHTAPSHPWFKEAKKGSSREKFSWYNISSNPASDVAAGAFPGISGYSSGEWHDVTVGEIGYTGRLHFTVDFSSSPKTITATPGTSDVQNSNTDTSVNVFLWVNEPGKAVRMYPAGADKYEITIDVDTPWGVLVRTSETTWDGGTKWGAASGADVLTFGEPLAITNSNPSDIHFGKSEKMKFQGAFGPWMPDLNYGQYQSASESGPFKALAESADKWIAAGVDGFRLDAVKHIYSNETGPENPEFLRQWYERCNDSYKGAGHSDNIYMVGEAWLSATDMAPYFRGLPALFEFAFWDRLEWVLNRRTGCYFAKDLMEYRQAYASVRSDAVIATKLTNHDQTRAATCLGGNIEKLKQAAAFLYTSEGEPYIYQGEELGYTGLDGDERNGRDELVRTPIVWDKASDAAVGALDGHVDYTLVTDANSVSKQLSSKESLLNTYIYLAKVRNSCPALYSGKMSAHARYNSSNTSDDTVACWYMTDSAGHKALVVHNVGAAAVTLDLSGDKLTDKVLSLGTVSVNGNSLILGGNSSAVFVQ